MSTMPTPPAAELLASVAEQLKVPLTTIARQAELSQLTDQAMDAGLLQTQATVALTLVDSYLLGLQLLEAQGSLALEPVSVASTLYEVAHQLHGFARTYGVTLDLTIDGRYEPVMAHRAGLCAALTSLGYALVEAQAAQSAGGRRLHFAVHRGAGGIVAGLYGSYESLGSAQLRSALALCGRARQPFTALAATSSAGIFVADTILQAMTTRLRVARHQHQTGLAATLLPSHQLQLV